MNKVLKPCPFCGQQDAFVEQLDSDASVVICQGMVDEHSACLARGPVGVQQSDMEDQPGRDAAIAEWNRRAQPAEADGVGVPVVAYQSRETGEFYEQSYGLDSPLELVLRSDHLAALSAVTAERDQSISLTADYIAMLGEASVQIDQLRAEVEELRPIHAMILNALDRDAEEGKTARGEMAAELRAAMAAKEA